MSVSVSYGQTIGYISATPFLHVLLAWIGGNLKVYALDPNGYMISPYNISFAAVGSPYSALMPAYSSLTISASFSYPIATLYMYAPQYTLPLIIAFDYPVLFVSINFNTNWG